MSLIKVKQSSVDGGVGVARKNAKPIIINGDCSVSQRGTAITDENSSGVYRVDRMNVGLSSMGEFRLSQESISSGDAYANGFTKAFRIDCAVADSSPASSDIANMTYKMEGNTVQAFKKGTANAEKSTLAFYVKCSKTGTAQVNLIDSDNSRMVSGTYTISSVNTWEKKIINFPADTTGALDNDNNKSLELEFALDGGSNFTSGSVQTSWGASNNANRSVNDFALQDNTANDWSITGVQLEVGEYTSSTLPPFQHESFDNNLERCLRYFYKRGNVSRLGFASVSAHTTSAAVGVHFFPTVMRATPSQAQSASTEFYITGSGQNQTAQSDAFGNEGISKFGVTLNATGSGLTQGYGYWLNTVDGDGYIEWSAEL